MRDGWMIDKVDKVMDGWMMKWSDGLMVVTVYG